MNSINRSGARAGFSLIEIIIALTLLAGVLGSLAGLSVTMSKRARLAQVLAERNMLMVAQINRVNAIPYDSLMTHAQQATASKMDTIYTGAPHLAFLRRDTVYHVVTDSTDYKNNYFASKTVLVPLDSVAADTVYKDSLILYRRNPYPCGPLRTC